jgi:hypothetical protein
MPSRDNVRTNDARVLAADVMNCSLTNSSAPADDALLTTSIRDELRIDHYLLTYLTPPPLHYDCRQLVG